MIEQTKAYTTDKKWHVTKIKKSADFQKLFKKNNVNFSKSVNILVGKIDEKYLHNSAVNLVRMGFVVSKKVSKKAVNRNLIKRRFGAIIQEIYRQNPEIFIKSTDYVLIASKKILEIPFDNLKRDVINCLMRFKNEAKNEIPTNKQSFEIVSNL